MEFKEDFLKLSNPEFTTIRMKVKYIVGQWIHGVTPSKYLTLKVLSVQKKKIKDIELSVFQADAAPLKIDCKEDFCNLLQQYYGISINVNTSVIIYTLRLIAERCIHKKLLWEGYTL